MTTLPQTTTTLRLPRAPGVPAQTGGPMGLAPASLAQPGMPQLTGADVWRVIRSNMWLIIGSVVVAGILGFGLNKYLAAKHPKYTATGVIEINPYAERDPRLMMTQAPTKEVVLIEQRTQSSKISSEALFSELLRNPRVRETAWFGSFGGDASLAKQDLKDTLRVSPVPDTRLIQVSFSSGNADDAREIVEQLVNLHIREEQERSLNQNMSRGQVLARLRDEINARRQDTLDRLHRAQVELSSAGAVLPGMGGGASPKDMELLKLVERGLELRAESQLAQSQELGITEAMQRGEDSPQVAERLQMDPNVMRYRQQIDDVNLQLAALNPDIGTDSQARTRLLRSKDFFQRAMDDYKAEIRATYQNQVLDAIRSARASAEMQLKAVTERIDELKREMGDLKSSQVEYLRMQEEDEKLSEELRTLQREIALVQEITRKEKSAGVQWATRPEKPDRMSFPKLPITLAMAIFLGLALSVGVAFLRELLDTSVRSPRDIARVGQMNLLGMVPHEDDDPQSSGASLPLIIAQAPHSMMAEQFRQIRTRLHHAASLDTTRSILLTSPSPEDGTTTVAVNLATGLSLNGRRILLVDANFRRPALHNVFKIGMDKGFADALQDNEQLPNFVHQTEIPNLDVLTTGPKPQNSTELLESQLFIDFIDRCLDEYDHVIFDTGPMLFVSDTVAMAPRVDGVITVVRARTNSRGVLQRLRDDLRKLRAEHLGVVLNAVKHHAGGYYNRNIKTYYEYNTQRV